MYIAFLDEFGHIGPFISRSDRRYNHNPVFGLAGYIIPSDHVRHFATWFYQLKNQLLASEISRSGTHPATWEKKGTDLFTTINIYQYRNVPLAGFRIINKIYKLDGRLFFYGRQKYLPPHKSNSDGLYNTVMSHSIRQLDNFCVTKNKKFMVILDQHENRIKLLATASKTMFGDQPARCLLEPPFQVESHLYQTIQAADWIATLVSRLTAYRVLPTQYIDWQWAERLFGRRIDENATHSMLWRQRPIASVLAAARQQQA
jgi:Protein of unknown function (DUF3800)